MRRSGTSQSRATDTYSASEIPVCQKAAGMPKPGSVRGDVATNDSGGAGLSVRGGGK